MEIEERAVTRMCAAFLPSITWTLRACVSLEIWCQCQWGSVSTGWNRSVKADGRPPANEGEFGAPAGEALAKTKTKSKVSKVCRNPWDRFGQRAFQVLKTQFPGLARVKACVRGFDGI